MTYSLCLSYINARHFKSNIDIWGNFVPGMIFFQSIFGYLVFTIVYKWCVDWYKVGQSPPGLLNTLIYMFLSPGTIEEPLYRGQGVVQVILLLVAVACVPILLFLKPFYLRWEHNRARALGYRGIGETTRVNTLETEDDDGRVMNGGRDSFASEADGMAMIAQDLDNSEHEEFEFSEVMIHQVIHTIGTYSTILAIVVSMFSSKHSGRILSELCLPHGLLSTALGFIASASAIVQRVMGHDTRLGLGSDRCSRRSHDGRPVLLMVCVNCRRLVRDGRNECDVA